MVMAQCSYVRGKMTYLCAHEQMKNLLTAVNIDASQLSLHSLRAGGVLAGLQTPGIPASSDGGAWRVYKVMLKRV